MEKMPLRMDFLTGMLNGYYSSTLLKTVAMHGRYRGVVEADEMPNDNNSVGIVQRFD